MVMVMALNAAFNNISAISWPFVERAKIYEYLQIYK